MAKPSVVADRAYLLLCHGAAVSGCLHTYAKASSYELQRKLRLHPDHPGLTCDLFNTVLRLLLRERTRAR